MSPCTFFNLEKIVFVQTSSTGVDISHVCCVYIWEHWETQMYIYTTYRPSAKKVPVDPNPRSWEQATFAASTLKPYEHTWVHTPSNCIWSLPAVELPPTNLSLPRLLSLLFTTSFKHECKILTKTIYMNACLSLGRPLLLLYIIIIVDYPCSVHTSSTYCTELQQL